MFQRGYLNRRRPSSAGYFAAKRKIPMAYYNLGKLYLPGTVSTGARQVHRAADLCLVVADVRLKNQ